jgi:phosphoglycolate phosphatase-like HAD superfamily hydrolase
LLSCQREQSNLLRVIRLVLFDIDGTLIRTGGAGVKAFERTFASEFSLDHGVERISFAGRTDPAIVREFFALHQVPPSAQNFQRFFESYVFWLDYFADQLRGEILPGVKQFMSGLQTLPNAPLTGLLTGNIQLGAEIKLRYYRLWENFVFGAFGNDHEDRNQLACIAKQRGSRILGKTLDGHEILVIGDTPLDVACSRAINARMLAVASGLHSLKQLRDEQPTWVVENLASVCVKEICG